MDMDFPNHPQNMEHEQAKPSLKPQPSTPATYFDCTQKCRSTVHGELICRIGGQLNWTDRDIVSHWSQSCLNYAHVKDEFGRMGIHVASAAGKHKAVEWLIKHEGCNLNAKDPISGYTPLHRTIFHGQIHVARNLIMMGASLSATDNEGLVPLDIWIKDRQNYLPVSQHFNPQSDPTELYIWGSNDNYNLGTEGQSSRLVPEPLEKFRKEPNVKISQVVLQTYHTAFLSQNGDVYCCGVGQGGRLGTGSENPCIIPQKLKFKSTEKVISIAAGVDHTVFLMENGTVRSCGQNSHCVLGQNPPPEKLLTPRTVETLKPIQVTGIKAGLLHSIFYTSTQLYVCGWNGGQFGPGFEISKSVVIPKRITSIISGSNDTGGSFTHVESNDVAIASCNSNGNLFLLYKSEVKRISMKPFDVVSLRVIGGSWSPEAKTNITISTKRTESSLAFDSSDFSPLTLLVLTTTGRIYIWRDRDSQNQQNIQPSSNIGNDGHWTWTRIVFTGIGRSIPVKSFSVGRNCMLILSETGEGFSCSWTPGRTPFLALNVNDPSLIKRPKTDADWGHCKNTRRKELDLITLPLELVKVKRIPNIFTGEIVLSDPKGTAFAILQRNQKLDFLEVPVLTASTMNQDLAQLLEEANLDDTLHDVEFLVGSMQFPAHQFIIATACPALLKGKLCMESSQLKIQIPNVNPKIFTQILHWIYTNSCELLTNPKSWTNLRSEKAIGLLKETIQFARKLGLSPLCKKLEQLEVTADNEIRIKNSAKFTGAVSKSKKFARESFQNMTDITFETLDKVEVKAHRCILVARMTYFHSMLFGNTWRESLSNNLCLPITSKSLGCLLDFVYSDELPVLSSMDLESVADVLQAGDQFLIEGLVPHVEVVLSDMLHLKNVGDILRMSYYYNAEQLRNSCFSFIALNLGQLLENRLLDGVEDEILEDVSKYYQNLVAPMQNSRRLKVNPLKLDAEEGFETQHENPELQYILQDFDKHFSNPLHSSDATFETSSSVTGKSKSSKITRLFKTNKNQRERERVLSESSVEHMQAQPNFSSLEPVDIYPGFSSNSRPSDWVKVQSHHSHGLKSKSKGSDPVPECIPKASTVSSPTTSPVRKTFGSENRSSSANNQGKSQFTTQQRSVPYVPIPNKEKAMKAENTRIRQLEIKFESMFDFPTLDNAKTEGLEKNLVDSLIKIELRESGSTSSAMPLGKSSKKKTKWKTVTLQTTPDEVPAPVSSTATEAMLSPSPSPPKNPWKMNFVTSPLHAQPTKIETFENILDEERQKKLNLERALEKSVHLTQIEERALEEFYAKYSTEESRNGSEILRVRRVTSCLFPKPVWPLKSP